MQTSAEYWNAYYARTCTTQDKHRQQEPSAFCQFVQANYIQPHNAQDVSLTIADVGCGTGADSHFFRQRGNIVYALDAAQTLAPHVHNVLTADAQAFFRARELCALLDVVYMRWFLHAVPHAYGAATIEHAVNNLKPGGLLCIEVRSDNDTALKTSSQYDATDSSFYLDHKRWLYSREQLLQLAAQHNLDVLQLEESRDFSLTNRQASWNQRPLLFRCIARKNVLPYYLSSPNYAAAYKDIVPLKRKKTLQSYEQLTALNDIFANENIRYVAIAGSSLGLQRHGGIIPWDDDIDLGFLEHDWERLLRLCDKLKTHGFTATKVPHTHATETERPAHYHVNLLDCFLLTRRGDFYTGKARTFCHVDEIAQARKQVFGYSHIYAAPQCQAALHHRYGAEYYTVGDVSDGCHYKNAAVARFQLAPQDYSYQTVD